MSSIRLRRLQQLAGPEQPLERNSLFCKKLGGAFLAVDDREHQLDFRAGILGGFDRPHGRFPRGRDVFEDGDALALQVVLLHAVDQLLVAVILHGLAHEKSRQRPVRRMAQHRDLRNQGHGPDRDPADGLHLHILELYEHELGQQARPLGVQHRRLHVQKIIAGAPGREPERSAKERETFDNLKQLFEIIKRLSFLRGSFVLSSGRTSNYFLDMKPTMLDPEGSSLLAELVLIQLQDVEVQSIGGIAIGAVPLVSQVAMLSHSTDRPLPGFFVRKAVKDHGNQKLIDGVKQDDLKGKRVAILEDVTTTGESAMRAIKAAQDAGAKIELVLAIVDREEGAAEFFAKQGIAFQWLFRASELLQATEPDSAA